MECKGYVYGTFSNFDYTFCTNEKCSARKDCARNLDKYPKEAVEKQRYFSMMNFEEVQER